MSCLLCTRPVADLDALLCESCRVADYKRMIERQRRREAERRASLPPDVCFLLNVMVGAGWSERAVTGAQHALSRPEPAVPAAFAHLFG